MINDTPQNIIDEVYGFNDIERRSRIQAKVTIGAALVVSLSVLAIKYDVHTNIAQIYRDIEDNKRNIERIEEDNFRIVPACYDSIRPDTYKVRECLQTEIKG